MKKFPWTVCLLMAFPAVMQAQTSFSTQQTFATGNTPNAATVADFNGDGKQDLAIPNSIDNTISILTGNGDGTFNSQQTYATGARPVSASVSV